jgi:undecaprenyl-diphosphatase
LAGIDWSLFHALNAGVATRDWLEDPVTTFAALAVPLYVLATAGLWFLARPYGDAKWKLAATSALASAAVALVVNQVISHLWDRPRPFAAHAAATHLLSAPSPDPSFPSDHAAAAFAIAFAVLAFSRRAGALFVVAALLVGVSRIALGLHYPSDVIAGIVVGWAAAMLVTRLGMRWTSRLAALVGRVSDPVLQPVWDRVARLLPARH